MNVLVAQAVQSLAPDLFSWLAAIVAIVGCVSAVIAAQSIVKDHDALVSASTSLISAESWIGALKTTESDLTGWLRDRKIDPESSIGEVILACWAAWLGSRSATMTEIHSLVQRRERSKIAPKLSGGIAALLIIVGIVGTLMCIHPLLSDFQFRVSNASGELQSDDLPSLVNVVDNTVRVNQLMNSLSRAFYPSVTALLGTIALVFIRGLYSRNLHEYFHKLDVFVTRSVMPMYRPRSTNDEWSEIIGKFDALADKMASRDSRFEVALTNFAEYTKRIGPVLESVSQAVNGMTNAGTQLDTAAGKVAASLSQALGPGSPLLVAVKKVESVFQSIEERLSGIEEVTSKIKREHALHVEKTAFELNGIKDTGERFATDLVGFAKTAEEATASLLNSAVGFKSEGVGVIRTGVTEMRKEMTFFISDQSAILGSIHGDVGRSINDALEPTVREINIKASDIRASVDAIKAGTEDVKKSLGEPLRSMRSEMSGLKETLSGAIESLKRQRLSGDASLKMPRPTFPPDISNQVGVGPGEHTPGLVERVFGRIGRKK
jgi:hypothetical protein